MISSSETVNKRSKLNKFSVIYEIHIASGKSKVRPISFISILSSFHHWKVKPEAELDQISDKNTDVDYIFSVCED